MNDGAADREWPLPPVGLLALCPLLAAADTLLSALCLAVVFSVTLAFVRGTAAWIGTSIASELRVIALFLIAGFWITVADLALQATLWPARDALGFYVPLLAANALILASAEQALRGPDPVLALRGGFRLGSVAAAWLIPLGFARELLGRGGVFTDAGAVPGWPGPFSLGAPILPLLQDAPGALLLLAIAAAFVARAGRGDRAR